MGGPNRHCILQIRSYAGEVELKQSRCAGMLVVFSEEDSGLTEGMSAGPRGDCLELKC